MLSFCYDASLYNLTCIDGKMNDVVKDLVISTNTLRKKVSNPWNADLPGHENLVNNLKIETEVIDDQNKKVNVDIKEGFVKITPKKVFEEIEKIQCKYCDLKYKSSKALKHHAKDKHPEKSIPKNVVEKEDKVTCRLCADKRKIFRDQLIKHLKRVHNVEKPALKELRGWETEDGGVHFSPVFRLKDETDILEAKDDT